MLKTILLNGMLLAGLMYLAGCQPNPRPPETQPAPAAVTKAVTNTVAPAASTNYGPQIYFVKGEVKEVKPDGRSVVVKHDEIKGYMPAMTMPFEVKSPQELADIKPGDKIAFRMLVTDTEGWIDRISVTERADPDKVPVRPTLRLVRDVDPLKIGDVIPSYPFTNELGQAFNFSQYRGQALAVTFLFTRCPFPNFCPRMNQNFSQVYKLLNQAPVTVTNWHLFSFSFDVEYDTPHRLHEYAQRYHYDPARWSFGTGALIDIDALTEQFGLVFSRQPGAFNFDHNLRTAVIDTRGRVQQIYIGNEWTPEQLVEQLKLAAAVPVEK